MRLLREGLLSARARSEQMKPEELQAQRQSQALLENTFHLQQVQQAVAVVVEVQQRLHWASKVDDRAVGDHRTSEKVQPALEHRKVVAWFLHELVVLAVAAEQCSRECMRLKVESVALGRQGDQQRSRTGPSYPLQRGEAAAAAATEGPALKLVGDGWVLPLPPSWEL